MTWYQVGIVFKELQKIARRANVFPKIIAAVAGQVGFLVHTRQSPKAWSHVMSAFPRPTSAVVGITKSE